MEFKNRLRTLDFHWMKCKRLRLNYIRDYFFRFLVRILINETLSSDGICHFISFELYHMELQPFSDRDTHLSFSQSTRSLKINCILRPVLQKEGARRGQMFDDNGWANYLYDAPPLNDDCADTRNMALSSPWIMYCRSSFETAECWTCYLVCDEWRKHEFEGRCELGQFIKFLEWDDKFPSTHFSGRVIYICEAQLIFLSSVLQ